MSASAKSPLRATAFVLQTATWELVARGDVARSLGLSNWLITRRLSVCQFYFEAVYRIAGPVLAPYAVSIPASVAAAAPATATALAQAR
jgi:hypothetical protein